MNEDKKKTLVLSIIGVIVLVVAVVGVSLAMYSFTGSGTKNNVITTGTISMTFGTVTGEGKTTNNYFTLTDEYPKTDARGIADATAKADFSVVGTWAENAGLTIDYEIGITDISETAGSLTSQYVKIVLYNGAGTPIVVGESNTGVRIADLANVTGTLITDGYYLTSGTLTDTSKIDNYKIVAWVASDYDLGRDTDAANTDTENGGSVAISTNHKKTTKAATYSFKLTLKAQQKTA